jgi:hypothetical protein
MTSTFDAKTEEYSVQQFSWSLQALPKSEPLVLTGTKRRNRVSNEDYNEMLEATNSRRTRHLKAKVSL